MRSIMETLKYSALVVVMAVGTMYIPLKAANQRSLSQNKKKLLRLNQLKHLSVRVLLPAAR